MRAFKNLVSPPHQQSQRGGAAGGQAGMDSDLGLSLLKSLTQTVLMKTNDLSVADRRHKIREILPLFIKVFRNSSGTEISAQFELVAPFAAVICRLLVEEIRARARHPSTVQASRAIMSYLLQPPPPATPAPAPDQSAAGDQPSSQSSAIACSQEMGRHLFQCINLVASAGKAVADELVSCSLPSTLVKCVYIFFDLPPAPTSSAEREERRAVEDGVRSVLVQLLRYSRAAAEELTQGDDLHLLLTAVTNLCPPHNLAWREVAGNALTALSSHALTPAIVNYIRRKDSIRQCLGKMREVQALSPLEMVEMFVTLFCLLKDSAPISTKLLDDFERHNGYQFLNHFLIKMDRCECEASIDATIRTLALSVLSLVYCGECELRPPNDIDFQFTLPDFSVPQPSSRGNSVRNVRAFDVLQQTFVNCHSASLLRTVLEVVSTVYNADVANFFILHHHNTLVHFARVLPNKSPEVWPHYFDVLDFVATTLRYVPVHELIALVSHLQPIRDLEFCRATLQFVQTLTLFHPPTYTRVLNHCDLLRVLSVTLADLGAAGRAGHDLHPDYLSYFHFVVQTLIMILKDNEANIADFKSHCGTGAVHALLVPEATRPAAALLLVSTLLPSSCGEDDTTLLLQRVSDPASDLRLKVDLLRGLAEALAAHSVVRARFRLAQGFVHVAGIIGALTNSLAPEPHPLPPWDAVPRGAVLELLDAVFMAIAAALHSDPANIRFFAREVRFEYVVNSLLLLGCFSKRRSMPNWHHEPEELAREYMQHNPQANYFHHEFLARETVPGFSPHVATVLRLFHMLMKVATDSYTSGQQQQQAAAVQQNEWTPPPALVHPGALLAAVSLVPAVCLPSKAWECAVQSHVLCVVRNLLHSSPRNCQVAARAGLLRLLLTHFACVLIDGTHPCHVLVHAILEELASHRTHVNDLRTLLRLGHPMRCAFNDEDPVANTHVPCDDKWRHPPLPLAAGTSANQGPPEDCKCCVCAIRGRNVPLNIIKSLVTLTTPRDVTPPPPPVDPAFIEFNMSFEGYSSVWTPCLVPAAGGGASGLALAVGPGATAAAAAQTPASSDRVFPPTNGFSYAAWVNVHSFASTNHPVRLLSVSRTFSNKPQSMVCFQVGISAVDFSLVVSTREAPEGDRLSFVGLDDPSGCLSGGSSHELLVKCRALQQCNQWNHIVIVLSRGFVKQSSCSVFVNGQLAGSSRIHYVSSCTVNPVTTAYTTGVSIGTPVQHATERCELHWRLASCFLLEETLTPAQIGTMFRLGPAYHGTFQRVSQWSGESWTGPVGPLVAEERVLWGVSAGQGGAAGSTVLTLGAVRRLYGKGVAAGIARLMRLSLNDEACPIRVLHNMAGHLAGASRGPSPGGVLVGHLGVRVFVPSSVQAALASLGCPHMLLELVGKADGVERLYASVKLLASLLPTLAISADMEERRWYQNLSVLLERKAGMINQHIAQILLDLLIGGGGGENEQGNGGVANAVGFSEVLLNLDIWHGRSSPEVPRLVYDQLHRLSTLAGVAADLMHRHGLLTSLVAKLRECGGGDTRPPTMHVQTSGLMLKLAVSLLNAGAAPSDVAVFAQYVASLLPQPDTASTETGGGGGGGDSWAVVVRNQALTALTHEAFCLHSAKLNSSFCQLVQQSLGFDWLLLFLQPHVHRATLVAAFRLLVVLLLSPTGMSNFKQGTYGGSWLANTQDLFPPTTRHPPTTDESQQQHQQQAGPQLDTCWNVPGFQALQQCMLAHTHVTQLYYLLFALTLSKVPIRDPPGPDTKLCGKQLCAYADFHTQSQPPQPPPNILMEPLQVIIVMLQHAIHKMEMDPKQQQLVTSEESHQSVESDVVDSLLQLLHTMLNQANPAAFFTPPVLHTIAAAVLFPPHTPYTECSGAGNEPRVRRALLDLLCTVVFHSIAFPLPAKTLPVFDTILQAAEQVQQVREVSREERVHFTTDLTRAVLDHVRRRAADLLDPDSSAFTAGGGQAAAAASRSHVCSHLVYLLTRVVDLLWQDGVRVAQSEVTDLLISLTQQADQFGAGECAAGLYTCLNRTLVLELDRAPGGGTDHILDQMYMLECFRKLVARRAALFSPHNNDANFFGALCFKIFSVVQQSRNAGGNAEFVAAGCQRLWNALVERKRELVESLFRVNLPPVGPAAGGHTSIDVCTFSEKYVDSAAKFWAAVLKEEAERSQQDALQLYTQLSQSRLTRLGSSFTKGISTITSRGTSLKSSSGASTRGGARRPVSVSVAEAMRVWSTVHVSVAEENVATLLNHHSQMKRNLVDATSVNEILSDNSVLLRERGLWGPVCGSRLDKWALDATEGGGPCRMRRRLRPNPHFYQLYPYRPEQEEVRRNNSTRKRVASSSDSKHFAIKHGLLPPTAVLERSTSVPSSKSPRDGGGGGAGDDEEADSAVAVSTNDSESLGGGAASASLDSGTAGGGGGASAEDVAELDCSMKEMDMRDSIVVSSASAGSSGQLGDSGDHNGSGQTGCEPQRSRMDSTSSSSAGQSEMQPPPPPPDMPAAPVHSSPSLFATLGVDASANCTMCRCARIEGLDNHDGLLVFFRDCFYIVDGYTLYSGQVADIASLPPGAHDPIIPPAPAPARSTTQSQPPSSTAGGGGHHVIRMSYDEIREIHKRRFLLQPIALELFSAAGRSTLLAFPVCSGHQSDRNKAYHKLLTFCPLLTTSAAHSVSGQKASTAVEGSTGIISTIIGEKSVTQRWERGEMSNFQYLMHLNTLSGRSYNDLMQYPVFPWILADYHSEALDLEDPATFRDLSKPMGAQDGHRLHMFLKRFKEWEHEAQFDTPAYHYGTHYSSAMIVCSFLVRLEPFAQHFLKLQGGHFDLADRMFHSVRDTWLSASRNNMADLRELIPEFFYLPDFLTNHNRFHLGRKQNGTVLGDVELPPWAKGSAREFIRVHREALESDWVSAHLHQWIDLVFGHKQRGPAAREAHNLFHHLFYEGNVDINSISDPLRKTAVIGFINNFGQIPEQLFKKPHPVRKAFLQWSIHRPYGTVYPAARLFFHHLDNLVPSAQLAPRPQHPHRAAAAGQPPVGQIRVVGDKDTLYSVPHNMALIPDQGGKFIAWGFVDGSVRLGSSSASADAGGGGGERMVCMLEGAPDIAAATLPSSKLLFTGGNTGVVTAWALNLAPTDEGKTYLRVVRQLYGHTGPVTCLACSPAYHVAVSGGGGGRDASVLVWDTNRLLLVRQLPRHFAPIDVVHVNNVTGDMVTTCGAHMYVWGVNGEPVAHVNSALIHGGGGGGRHAACAQAITCVATSEVNEWHTENVVLTGSSDGVVRMWSVEMLQTRLEPPDTHHLPSPPAAAAVEGSETGLDDGPGRPHPPPLSKAYSMDSLDEAAAAAAAFNEDFDSMSRDARLGSAAGGGGGESQPISGSLDDYRPAAVADWSRLQSVDEAAAAAAANQDSVFSEDTAECFDLVSEADVSSVAQKREQKGLKPGFCWRHQLVFRSKLTTHTAFERADNPHPAPVTALALNPDHSRVYVGDGRGRIFHWSVAEGAAGSSPVDHWVKDESSELCMNSCGTRFSFTERRHHCRNCGFLFCSRCSNYQSTIPQKKIHTPVRVCQTCCIDLNQN